MGISIWYVYDDAREQWVSTTGTTKFIGEAQEFFSEGDAQKVANEIDGMVMGWCQ